MALIRCPECGKSISDKAETCIYCGYPAAMYPPEQREPDVQTEKPDAGSAARSYNARLAVTAFIGLAGSLLLSLLARILVYQSLGSAAIAAISLSSSVQEMLVRGLIILLIIGFFKSSKVLNYIAIGYEVTAAMLMIAIPGVFARLSGAGEEVYSPLIANLRMTGIVWMVMGGVCVLLGFVVRSRKMMVYFIVLAAVYLQMVVINLLLVPVFGYGTAGAAFSGMVQPVRFLLPLLLFNPDPGAHGSGDVSRKA